MGNKGGVSTVVITAALLAGANAFADSSSITLITLDENHKPLSAQQLEWWYDDNNATKSVMECETDACSTWELPAVAISNTSISLLALVFHSKDSACADWHTGELTAQKQNLGAGYFEVQLKHTVTACK